MPDFMLRSLEGHEIEIAANLIAETLAGGDSHQYKNLFEQYRHIVPSIQVYRGFFIGKQLVSCLLLHKFNLRYGRASLAVAGIGAVCTDIRQRGRGYASALIKDSLTYLAEQGVHMALLNANIPHFYERFGFSPVWPHYTLEVPTKLAAALPQACQLRLAVPQDLAAIAELYEQHWGGRVSFERNAAAWRWRMAYGRGETLVALDSNKRIQAYFWQAQADFSERVEVVANTPDAIMSFLAYSGRLWQDAGYSMFRWSLTPDDMIIPHAQQLLPITLSASYFPHEGWMARLIDAAAILEALLPEISAQAKTFVRGFETKNLVLRLLPNGVDIALKNETASQCHLSLRDFIQILFGSLRPETLAVRQPLSREAIYLLETLFPARVAAIGAWDWF